MNACKIALDAALRDSSGVCSTLAAVAQALPDGSEEQRELNRLYCDALHVYGKIYKIVKATGTAGK